MTSRASSSMPVDERGLAAARDGQAERVPSGAVDHAAVVAQAALLVDDSASRWSAPGSSNRGKLNVRYRRTQFLFVIQIRNAKALRNVL